MQTIVYDSDLSGRFEIWLKNLDINNAPVGAPVQLTNAGAAQQQAQEPQFSLVASANAATNLDFLGRIVYQFGTSGVRGLHLIKPLPYSSNTDVQLTPQPGSPYRASLGSGLASKYPCTDARDPAWSPDGLHIVYACLEPLTSGIGSSYDLWIHDTNGTPDNPNDDADYPLLVQNGPLALQPAWSPDGTMIALVTNAPGTNSKGPTSKICVIQVPATLGTALSSCSNKILTDDAFNDIAPAWDPSSSFIAFSTTRKGPVAGPFTNAGNRTIWTMTSTGQIVSQLTGTSTSTANDTHPSWPSLNLIYFQSDRSGVNNNWLIDAAEPEDFGGSVVQVTGVSGDSSESIDSSSLFTGIDISDGSGPITSWNQIRTPSGNALPAKFIVVDLYGGLDGSYVNGGCSPGSGGVCNPGCQPTNLTSPGTSSDPACGSSNDVQNLINAQTNLPTLPTGAYILLSFTLNSQPQNPPLGAGYGKHAVDYAYAAVGSAAWNKLKFVAIDVEIVGSYWGLDCAHVNEIANAIIEARVKSQNPINIVIYTIKSHWEDLTGSCAPTDPTVDPNAWTTISSVKLWEAGGESANDNKPSLSEGTDLPFGNWTIKERQGKQYACGVGCNAGVPGSPYGINGVVDLDIFAGTIMTPPAGSIGPGANVGASVVDSTTGIASLAVTFSNSTQAGVTTASSSTTGFPPPSGYKPVIPQTYYDLTTSALYAGAIQVCVNYTGTSFGIQANLALFHYENNAWVNRTVSNDTTNNILCASVTSLSPFAIFEAQATPVVSVTGGSFVYDGKPHAATATATGAGGVLVTGSFSFTYNPGGSSPPVSVGTYSVTAQFTSSDPNYANANGTGSITITAAVPLITSISPATGSQGQTLANVVITGQSTHFVQGTTTCSFGAGITVNSCTVNSPTSATANITIGSSATPGSQTITVTTGAEVATLLNGFIITAPVFGKPNLVWLGGGHTGGVQSVGAAPDGTVWSAAGDSTIKQWNAANMNLLRTFPLAQTGGAAFAGNGQQGLVIDANGVQNVSLADGSVSRTFALGDLGGAYLPAISANGQTIAFGRSNYAADVLVFANGTAAETDILASGYATDGYLFGGVNALAVSADGQYVAAALSADYQTPGTIRLYRASDGTLLRLLTHNTANVQALAFTADGTMLASSSTDGKINVLRLSDLVVVSSILVSESGTPTAGTTLAFSPDGTQIALGDPSAARIFHLPDGASLGRIPGATTAVAFTPDGQWLVVGGGQDVRLWLLSTLASLPTVATHSGSITAVAYSPRGDLVASASTDLTVKLRSAVDGTLVASLTGHTDTVNAIAFSPDGDMLATGSSDHTIRIWRTSDFALLTILIGHTQAVRTLAFSPDGSLLASGSSAPEGVVRLWSVGGTWSNTSTLTGTGGNVTSLQFSPDGQSLAGASDGGIVRIWQVNTGAVSRTYLAPSQGGMSLAFSPDGQTLVAGWGQDILVFQGTQTSPAQTIAAHSKSGTVVAYSPDGLNVLSGNPDGTLKVWNPAGWALVTSYNQETDAGGTGVTSVAYSPDNTRFVYGRADATIGVARTGSAALLATVTVTTNPPGLAISVDGTAYAGPHTFSWTPGTSHIMSVGSPQGASGTRYVFVGWSDGGAPTHTVMPVGSRIYTAVFMTQELLTVQITPSGGGTVVASPTSPDGYYAAGTVVQLTETPAQGYDFASWSGDASGKTSTVTTSMSQPRSVTATFTTVALADIAVAMSSSVTQINSGKPLAFTVTVTNLGPSTSAAMTLIVNLPAAYSLVSASSSRGSCTGTVQVSCPLGTIQVTDIVTATINVTPIATGSISMTASVNGGTADPNPSNNSATVTVTVLPAGRPPILWMGGSPGTALFQNIQTTSDGLIWAVGPQELVQWRASDLRLMHTLAPDIGWYNDPVYRFAVTPDGKTFTYNNGTSLGVYNSDGTNVASFAHGDSYISISGDGTRIASQWGATGAYCCAAYFIDDVTKGSAINATIGAGEDAISPNGALLAVANGPSGVYLYNTADFSVSRVLTGISQASYVTFSPDGSLLMAASSTQLVIWRVSDFLLLQNLAITSNSYYWSATISSDAQFVAYGTDSTASVWRVSDGSSVASFPAQCAFGIAFTTDNQSLVCNYSRLSLYGLPQGVPSPYLSGNTGTLNAIVYSTAGNLIATAGNDSIISVWDTAAGKVLSQVNSNASNPGSNPITGLAFSPDGTKLAAGVNNNITIWNTSGYAVAATLTGHSQRVTAVAFSPDGTLLASASTAPEQVVKLWSTQTWTLVRTLVGASGGILSVQFSPDGKTVVASSTDGTARQWNVTTGSVVNSYLATGQGSMRIQYSPDGTKLAAGWNGKVLLFNVGTSTPIQTLNAHTQNNTSVAWSPDGKRLISGNPDGTVDVWDTSTWGQLSQYNSETYAQGGGVLTVAYSPDNSQFAYGRADSVVVAVDSGSSPTGTLTTVTTNPAGLNIVVDGATTASPQTFRWAAGTTHSIGAPSPQGSNGTRNVFGNWSDGGTQTHTITTPSTGATYTAQFNPQYLLTPSVLPGGAGSILVTPTSTDGYYDSGTAVQAVATPNIGYVFGTWSGAATGTTNPASVVMTAPQSITANYGVLPATIVTTNPPGLLVTVDGTQYTSPQSFNWAAGSMHTVAVSSEQGTRAGRYTFANWGDGGSISHTITAPSASTSYIATFNTQYPLATNSNPAGGGTIVANPSSGDGYYNSGTNVQLTATVAAGYRFAGWSGDVSGTTNPLSVTMSAARSAIAHFLIVTSTALSSSLNPSAAGQSVTFTATVTAAGGTPTGTVTFYDGTTSLGTGTLSAGNATLVTSALAIGSHSITAQYGGDANFSGSVSTAITQVIGRKLSGTTLVSSLNPSAVGQSVMFTATVTGAGGTATGTVTFYDGTTSLGTGTLNGSGVAVLSTATLIVGSHSITAQYGGDANFAASVSTAVTQVISGKPSGTTLASSLNPSVVGQSVTFTATVTGTGGTPTGTVTFVDGTTSLGTGTLSAGNATLVTSALAIGSHSITAQYGGDANFSGSTSSPALRQVVSGKPSATALVSSLNPEVAGQTVVFTATVTSTAGGTPTGTVTFFNGSTALGPGAVTLNGSGMVALATTVLVVGSPSITASYSGDANYAASTSPAVTETVNAAGFAPAPTGLTVTAGQSLPISLTLYAAAGSGLNFTLSCVGAPSKTNCLFGSNPVAAGPPPNGTTVQLTLGTSSSRLPGAPSNRSPWSLPLGTLGISAALAALLAGIYQLRRAPRRRLAFGICLAVLALASVLIGCGGGGGGSSSPPPYTGTPKGTATFTVTGTSGATTISTPVTITVQ